MDIPRTKKSSHRKKIRYVAYGLGLLACVALVTYGLSRLKPASASVDRSTILVDTVRRGSMLRQVRGAGALVTEQVRLIPAPVEGRVERILVEPGQQVRPGTLIAELVNPQLLQEATDIEYQIKAAEADYTNLRVRLDSEKMAQEAGTATIQSEYSQARLQLDTDEELAREGLIPALNLKLSRVRVQELANRLNIERQRLSIGTQSTRAQLASQQTRIEQLRALSALRRTEVASLRVLAGTSGVLQQVAVEVGQQVTPGMNLARVVDPSSLKAELKIEQTQAKDITLGQRATIDTRNGTVVGRVARIDPSIKDGTVTVDVALEGTLPQGARPDLSVDGIVELERLSDVLYVRRPSFGQGQSTVGMFKLEDGGKSAVRTQVRLGRGSVTAIEVLDGLREGDEVIVSDTSAWDKHDRIVLK
ncbi:MAG TPA: HlyD family efflux transporter periplasmic adaptor subunit [Pyrinomonadaceae bacterium]|jgi:HlyD family secretion protein